MGKGIMMRCFYIYYCVTVILCILQGEAIVLLCRGDIFLMLIGLFSLCVGFLGVYDILLKYSNERKKVIYKIMEVEVLRHIKYCVAWLLAEYSNVVVRWSEVRWRFSVTLEAGAERKGVCDYELEAISQEVESEI